MESRRNEQNHNTGQPTTPKYDFYKNAAVYSIEGRTHIKECKLGYLTPNDGAKEIRNKTS